MRHAFDLSDVEAVFERERALIASVRKLQLLRAKAFARGYAAAAEDPASAALWLEVFEEKST